MGGSGVASEAGRHARAGRRVHGGPPRRATGRSAARPWGARAAGAADATTAVQRHGHHHRPAGPARTRGARRPDARHPEPPVDGRDLGPVRSRLRRSGYGHTGKSPDRIGHRRAGLGRQPTATAAPGVQRRAVRSGRRVDARPRERGGPVPASTSRPRSVYFGWFGMFMALTGRNIVAVLRVAVAALCTGLASTLVARRLLHTA